MGEVGEVLELLKIQQAAAALGVSRSYLRQLLVSGEFPVVRLGRSIRIPASDLRIWLKQRRRTWQGEVWADSADDDSQHLADD